VSAEWTGDELERLLGRAVRARVGALERDAFAGRRVLITGAGGTIGSALAREIAGCDPDRLGLVEQSELALFRIERELRAAWPALRIDAHLADVTRRASMLRACRETAPEVVYHAAAYKHVTMAERAPAAAAHVNVVGTAEAARAARLCGARFVLISSDKAADPRSVMGATKRLAEIVSLRSAAPGFRPIVVRFGNVLGSSGSVLEIMRDCIARGVPIPMTDPGATRYFMTPAEAVALVLRADLLGRAAEIFWLEMGRPIRMGDLAARLLAIESAAGRPPVPLTIVGLRPGEKRNEVLADRRLSFVRTIDRRIRVARDPARLAGAVAPVLGRLRAAMARADDAAALDTLVGAVDGFHPSDQARDVARRARLARTRDALRSGRRRGHAA
jgi:O-antigen biosynthesis protein WbqV